MSAPKPLVSEISVYSPPKMMTSPSVVAEVDRNNAAAKSTLVSTTIHGGCQWKNHQSGAVNVSKPIDAKRASTRILSTKPPQSTKSAKTVEKKSAMESVANAEVAELRSQIARQNDNIDEMKRLMEQIVSSANGAKKAATDSNDIVEPSVVNVVKNETPGSLNVGVQTDQDFCCPHCRKSINQQIIDAKQYKKRIPVAEHLKAVMEKKAYASPPLVDDRDCDIATSSIRIDPNELSHLDSSCHALSTVVELDESRSPDNSRVIDNLIDATQKWLRPKKQKPCFTKKFPTNSRSPKQQLNAFAHSEMDDLANGGNFTSICTDDLAMEYLQDDILIDLERRRGGRSNLARPKFV